MNTIQFVLICAGIAIAVSFLGIYTVRQFVLMGKDPGHYSTFPLRVFRKVKQFKSKKHSISNLKVDKAL